MAYSYDELFKINGRYCSEHRLTQSDIDTVNSLCARIKGIRQGNPTPTDGDKIICIGPTKGEVSKRGYLEKRENRLSVCVDPYIPFISAQSLSTDASGGPWFNFSEEQFEAEAKYAGKTQADFKVWGHLGPCGNGAVYFQAEVFLWKVTDAHFD